MTALRWPLSTKKKMDLMSDNVYYLQDAFKPKASESDSQLSQFVERALAQKKSEVAILRFIARNKRSLKS